MIAMMCLLCLLTAVKYEETTETSVRIHWPKPASTETNITGFIWEYSTEGLEEFNHTGKSPDLSSSITSAVLDGLEEGTQYNIWVKAAPANPTVESETLMHIVKTLPSSECTSAVRLCVYRIHLNACSNVCSWSSLMYSYTSYWLRISTITWCMYGSQTTLLCTD